MTLYIVNKIIDYYIMKQIPGFPNYIVTKDGKVWSATSKKYLKLMIFNKYGHQHVCLFSNKKRFWRSVHRLVLETFVGLCPKSMECRHLDGNAANNNLSNLRWGTRSENRQDAIKHGTLIIPYNKGEKCGTPKLIEQDVRMIVYMYRIGEFTQREIAEIYEVCRQHISEIVNKKKWKHIWAK